MLSNIWKAHDSNSWQNNFINRIQIYNQSPWFEIMAIYLLKPNSHWQHQKPNSHWQYQKPNLRWHYLSEAQGYQYLVKYYIIIISPRSPIMTNALDS